MSGGGYPNWPNYITGGSGTLQSLSINGQVLSLNPGGGSVTIPTTTAQVGENLIVSSLTISSNATFSQTGNLATSGTITATQNITSSNTVVGSNVAATTLFSGPLAALTTVNATTISTGTAILGNTTSRGVFQSQGASSGANFWTIGSGLASSMTLFATTMYGTTFRANAADLPQPSSLNIYAKPICFSTPVTFLGSVTGIPGISSGVVTINSLSTATTYTNFLSLSTINWTTSFDPNFNPSVDINLGNTATSYLGKATIATAALGVVVGGVALATGVAALANSRTTNYINKNNYETINGTTQLQVSSLGAYYSTIYRYTNSSNQEIFTSTIYPPSFAIRSFSDPLYGVSTPTQAYQSFGQWVSLSSIVGAGSGGGGGGLVTIPANLSTTTVLASNYVSTATVYASSVKFLQTTLSQNPNYSLGFGNLRFGTTLNPLSNTGITVANVAYGPSGNGYLLDTGAIYNTNKWRIGTTDQNSVNNVVAYLADIPAFDANPVYSTLTVSQSSIIAGVSLSNGVINTPAMIQCFAFETLGGKAFTSFETPLLATSTITNTSNIQTKSLTASTITAAQMNFSSLVTSQVITNSLLAVEVQYTSSIGYYASPTVLNVLGNATIASVSTGNINCSSTINTQLINVVQDGSYIPFLSTNQLIQGFGYAIDSDTNAPYLSTLGTSTISLWAKSPSSGGNQKLITSCDISTNPYQGGQYYKTTPQNCVNGATDITFNASTSWTNTAITQTTPSTFTVNTPGIYQLDLQLTSDPNGATFTTTARILQFVLLRGTSQTILANTIAAPSATSVNSQTAIVTYELLAGDVLTCRYNVNFSAGTPTIRELQNVFDLNTFFTWSLLNSTDSGSLLNWSYTPALSTINVNNNSIINVASVSTNKFSLGGKAQPQIQFGTSTFQAAVYDVLFPGYTTSNFTVFVTPYATTNQTPHAYPTSLSSFAVHAGSSSAGVQFQWMTLANVF